MRGLRAFCLIILLLCFNACREQILHDLDETDANKLLARLTQGGVVAEKIKQADGRWGIAVDSSDGVQAISFLNATRSLKASAQAAPHKTDLLSSREEQRFAFERAISSELERTISSMPGVLETRVHLNLPASDPIFGQALNSNGAASASVLVVSNPEFGNNIEQIQALVSGAAGILPAKVTVVVTAEPLQREKVDINSTEFAAGTGAAQAGAQLITLSGGYGIWTVLISSILGVLLLYAGARGRRQFKF